MIKCNHCEEEIIGNSRFIIRLKRLSMTGYDDLDFCNVDCFLRYITKKYKKKLNRLGY